MLAPTHTHTLATRLECNVTCPCCNGSGTTKTGRYWITPTWCAWVPDGGVKACGGCYGTGATVDGTPVSVPAILKSTGTDAKPWRHGT